MVPEQLDHFRQSVESEKDMNEWCLPCTCSNVVLRQQMSQALPQSTYTGVLSDILFKS